MPSNETEMPERALTAAVHWAKARAALDRAEGMEAAARCLELLVTALDDTRAHVARLTRELSESRARAVQGEQELAAWATLMTRKGVYVTRDTILKEIAENHTPTPDTGRPTNG